MTEILQLHCSKLNPRHKYTTKSMPQVTFLNLKLVIKQLIFITNHINYAKESVDFVSEPQKTCFAF